MRILINIIGILFGFLFIFNVEICDYFYNYSDIDQRLNWINLRYRAYEFIMLLLSFLMVMESKNTFTKMMFSFVGVLILFSLSDKVVFNLNSYSYTDALSIFCALMISIVVFNKTQNKK